MFRQSFLALSVAALTAVSGLAMAQTTTTPPPPAAPMAQPAPAQPGPVARAEEGVKKAGRATVRTAKKAGAATKRGAKKVGGAVTNTGNAIGEKVGPDPRPNKNNSEKIKNGG